MRRSRSTLVHEVRRRVYTLEVLSVARVRLGEHQKRLCVKEGKQAVVLMTHGRMRARCGKDAWTLWAEQVLMLNGPVRAALRTASKAQHAEVVILEYRLAAGTEPAERGGVPLIRRLNLVKGAQIRRLTEKLVSAWEGRETAGDGMLMVWAMAARVLGAVEGSADMERARSGGAEKEQKLKHVLGWIESHLSQRVSLPQMAAGTGLTRTHFAQWFRARVGQSPMRYLRQRRIERAKGLLASMDLTVREVARLVGFEDPAHFNRVFRAMTGGPPGRYTRRHWRQV